jgi:UDP:flavonoid glycosyltransferase YjiC (YdhE family)
MPHTRVLVSHGGSGTLRAGLAAGIPQVVLPIFADQPYNARRVDALGAGIAIEDTTGLAAAVRTILEDDRFASSAATVAADIRNLPPVERAAARLRELAEVREAA